MNKNNTNLVDWGVASIYVDKDYIPYVNDDIYVELKGTINKRAASEHKLTYDMLVKELDHILSVGFTGKITNVIFNPPATIVFWSDGTKTVVKAHEEKFDPEKGLAMAISKKLLGNSGNYNNLFKKWVSKYEEQELDEATKIIEMMNETMDERINAIYSDVGNTINESMTSSIAKATDNVMTTLRNLNGRSEK